MARAEWIWMSALLGHLQTSSVLNLDREDPDFVASPKRLVVSSLI